MYVDHLKFYVVYINSRRYVCCSNCDDVCMCVVNKQYELLEFVFESVYVDLQYDDFSHFYCWVCVFV